MALSTNAVAPDAPTDSTAIDGLLGLGNDDQEIRNFIASMSPSGASAYDTGWVNVTLRSGFTAQGGILPQVRRVGKRVDWRWGISNAGLAAADTTYTFADVPAGHRPTTISAYGYAAANTSAAGGRIDVSPAGAVTLRTGTSLGTYYLASFSWYVD